MKKMTPTQIQQREFQERSRKNTQFIQTFCNTLVKEFGFRTTKDQRRSIVYWLDSKRQLNHLLVRYQMRPDSYFDSTPWIVRIFINHYEAAIPQSSLRELLGRDYYNLRDHYPTARTRGRTCSHMLGDFQWSFELSLFPEQLQQAIPWIVPFAHNKDQGLFDETVVPPFACRWWGGNSDHCRYAWSEAAHIAYEAWNEPRIRERERAKTLREARKAKMQAASAFSEGLETSVRENKHVQ